MRAWCDASRCLKIVLAKFAESWQSADWKVSYSDRRYKGRRNFALARNQRNFIFSASICGQFPANRFAGLSGILFTHTRARTEHPWWRASAWGDDVEGVWAFTHERKRSPTEWKELACSKRMAKYEKLRRVERRVDCRDCSRLPEKKTRIRGRTFEGKKKGGNRGNREVDTTGWESTRV